MAYQLKHLSLSETDSLQKKVQSARFEARSLYEQLAAVRRNIQDTSLVEVAKTVQNIIPGNYLQLYNTLKGHRDKIAKVRWSADSTKILSTSQDGFMIIWDPVTGLKKQAITLDNSWVLSCAYSPSGKLVASGGLDNACTIHRVNQIFDEVHENSTNSYEMHHPSTRSVFKGHTAYISDCSFLDDTSIVTSSGDMSCALWDLNKSTKIRDFIDHLGDVLTLSVDSSSAGPSNSFLSGSSDGYVKVWDVRTRHPVQNFFIANSDVNCVKNFTGGHSFVTGTDDGVVRFFDLRSDCEISKYLLQRQSSQVAPHSPHAAVSPTYSLTAESLRSTYDIPGVISVDFSKSGRLIYVCYSDYGCLIWDSLKNEIVGSVGTGSHSNVINQVSVSSDGVGLATASWDSTIKIWAA